MGRRGPELRLELTLRGHVANDREHSNTPAVFQLGLRDFGVEPLAASHAMRCQLRRRGSHRLDRRSRSRSALSGHDVRFGHRCELPGRILVLRLRGLVDGEEAPGLRVGDEGRQRVLLKEESEGAFAVLEHPLARLAHGQPAAPLREGPQHRDEERRLADDQDPEGCSHRAGGCTSLTGQRCRSFIDQYVEAIELRQRRAFRRGVDRRCPWDEEGCAQIEGAQVGVDRRTNRDHDLRRRRFSVERLQIRPGGRVRALEQTHRLGGRPVECDRPPRIYRGEVDVGLEILEIGSRHLPARHPCVQRLDAEPTGDREADDGQEPEEHQARAKTGTPSRHREAVGEQGGILACR